MELLLVTGVSVQLLRPSSETLDAKGEGEEEVAGELAFATNIYV
jgi:hypothetical protein